MIVTVEFATPILAGMFAHELATTGYAPVRTWRVVDVATPAEDLSHHTRESLLALARTIDPSALAFEQPDWRKMPRP